MTSRVSARPSRRADVAGTATPNRCPGAAGAARASARCSSASLALAAAPSPARRPGHSRPAVTAAGDADQQRQPAPSNAQATPTGHRDHAVAPRHREGRADQPGWDAVACRFCCTRARAARTTPSTRRPICCGDIAELVDSFCTSRARQRSSQQFFTPFGAQPLDLDERDATIGTRTSDPTASVPTSRASRRATSATSCATTTSGSNVSGAPVTTNNFRYTRRA